MKTKSKIGGYILRGGAAAVLFSSALLTLASAFNLPNRSPNLSWRFAPPGTAVKAPKQDTTLNFAERVTYQRAIEEVYWRHRIWPKANGAKPSLDELISADQIKGKVEAYLCDSQALEQTQPITAEQLQAEMDRMAQHTRQPKVLRELFAALGNDPAVIAECLAKPTLTARLVARVARDKAQSVSSSRGPIRTMSTGTKLAQGALYTLPQISAPAAAVDPCIDDWSETSMTNAPAARTFHSAVWTGSEMIIWGGGGGPLNTGGRYNPATNTWTATSGTNAPSARIDHTAVWTGTEMIVWGGFDGTNYLNSGARYIPG